MGGDIEGRIPNPNSCRGKRGGKNAGIWLCESSQAVVTCPLPWWFLELRNPWNLGILTPKGMKAWTLAPSNKFRPLSTYHACIVAVQEGFEVMYNYPTSACFKDLFKNFQESTSGNFACSVSSAYMLSLRYAHDSVLSLL